MSSDISPIFGVPRKPKLRSRIGCARCRKRHQKCDELRPVCSRCFDAAEPCEYARPMPHLQQSQHASNIETLTPEEDNSPPMPVVRGFQTAPCGDVSTQGQLLMYFIYEASAAISCHENLQQDTCRALISAGAGVPCLWYSALLFAAMHRASSNDAARGPTDDALELQVLSLRNSLLTSLQLNLQSGDDSNREAILATTLMLTMAEIHFQPHGGTWRTHWSFIHRERKARQDFVHSRRSKPQDTSLTRFVDRRFSVLDLLTSLPTSSRQASQNTRGVTLPYVDEVGVIDGTLACCIDLLSVFGCISELQDQRKLKMLKQSEIAGMGRSLIAIIERMMTRDEMAPPQLSDEIRVATDGQLREYRLCNCAAQHMALVCVQRYLMGQDPHSSMIQQSVLKIVEIAEIVTGHCVMSPAVCLVTPLFVAGCNAEIREQNKIAILLERQYALTRSCNTQRTLQVLREIWMTCDGVNGSRIPSKTAICPADFLPY